MMPMLDTAMFQKHFDRSSDFISTAQSNFRSFSYRLLLAHCIITATDTGMG